MKHDNLSRRAFLKSAALGAAAVTVTPILGLGRNAYGTPGGGGTPGKSGGAVVYDVRTGKELGRFGERKDAVLTASLSPRAELVAVGGYRGFVGRAALEYAQRYVQDRTAFGVPIAQHQAVAFLVADMAKHAVLMFGARSLDWLGALGGAGCLLQRDARGAVDVHDLGRRKRMEPEIGKARLETTKQVLVVVDLQPRMVPALKQDLIPIRPACHYNSTINEVTE